MKKKTIQIKHSYVFFYNENKNQTYEYLEKSKPIQNISSFVEQFDSLYISHFSKKNISSFQKKQIDLKLIAVFENGFQPKWEDDKFENGGYYEFDFIYSNKIHFQEFFIFLFSLLQKYTELKGFRIKLKSFQNKHTFYIQLWSIQSNQNTHISHDIQHYFHSILNINIQFKLFYPEPIPSSNVISYNEIDNKKIYYLRFDVGIGQFLKKGIWWEEFMKPYFQKYYRSNTNVIDVGANFGTHSILLANIISKNCQVFSFEPIYWDITMMNADANNMQDKICVFNKGLGKKNEVIKIKTYDRSMKKPYGRVSLHGLSGLQVDKDLNVEKEVGILTLDSLHLNNISLIKIDVEGMELDVLEGAKETITRNKPIIFIEFLKSKYNQDMESPIMKYLLGKCNYQLIPIQESYAGDDYILVPKK